MIKILDTFREIFKRWIIPAGWLEFRRIYLTRSTQKFWRGSLVDAPPIETLYFSQIGKKAHTITYLDDSRSAIYLNPGVTHLPTISGSGDVLQFAISADKWSDSDYVYIVADGESINHNYLKPRCWLDIRLPLTRRTLESFYIKTSRPIYLSYPRLVTTLAQPNLVHKKLINHVLVIVLDGMTPYFEMVDSSLLPGGKVSPNIDRFFAKGFFASNAWSTGEWTLPTTASFFTGLYTSRHGAYHPTLPTYMPSQPLLAEILQDHGFHTLALSTANRLTPAYGSHRGFDRFIYHWPYHGYTSLDYDPARWCHEICSHLDLHRNDRSFIYAHFPDTHPVWDIPPLTRSFNLLRRGDGVGHNLSALKNSNKAKEQGPFLNMIRLHELDRILGGVFNFIETNISDETLVILTSDHGTPWSQLRALRPADEPYLVNHRTKINFKMRGPGVLPANFERLCSPSIDLLPTIFSKLGIAIPDGIDGLNMLNPCYSRNLAISESFYGGKYELALRSCNRVYIEKYLFNNDNPKFLEPPFYMKLFDIDENDYSNYLNEDISTYKMAARRHIEKVGMTVSD